MQVLFEEKLSMGRNVKNSSGFSRSEKKNHRENF